MPLHSPLNSPYAFNGEWSDAAVASNGLRGAGMASKGARLLRRAASTEEGFEGTMRARAVGVRAARLAARGKQLRWTGRATGLASSGYNTGSWGDRRR